MSGRKGEEDRTHFRSERVENINGGWFFRTRESLQLVGPYKSRREALHAAHGYAEDLQKGQSELTALNHRYINKVFSLE